LVERKRVSFPLGGLETDHCCASTSIARMNAKSVRSIVLPARGTPIAIVGCRSVIATAGSGGIPGGILLFRDDFRPSEPLSLRDSASLDVEEMMLAGRSWRLSRRKPATDAIRAARNLATRRLFLVRCRLVLPCTLVSNIEIARFRGSCRAREPPTTVAQHAGKRLSCRPCHNTPRIYLIVRMPYSIPEGTPTRPPQSAWRGISRKESRSPEPC